MRELENVLELMINTEAIPSHILSNGSEGPDEFVEINEDCYRMEFVEKQHIIKVLGKMSSNITMAAKALGVSRCTLYRKMKEYGIS